MLIVPAVKEHVQTGCPELIEKQVTSKACDCSWTDPEIPAALLAAAADGVTTSVTSNSMESTVQVWEQLPCSKEGCDLMNSKWFLKELLSESLPCRYCCSDPDCDCSDKPSELRLASGKAAGAAGVVWHATVSSRISTSIGKTTRQHAKNWQQQEQEQERAARTSKSRGHNSGLSSDVPNSCCRFHEHGCWCVAMTVREKETATA